MKRKHVSTRYKAVLKKRLRKRKAAKRAASRSDGITICIDHDIEGRRFESAIAEISKRIGEMLPKPETILQEADRIVSTDRQNNYGHPFDDFTRTGRIWGAILGIPDVPPEKVALCMVGVKMSREVNHPKRDNRVDGAGYFKTADMVHERLSQMRG